MTRKLASVQTIVSISPIEKADKIEKVGVLGWECVVQKSEGYKVGDRVVYVEVDSIMPPKPEYEFLKDRKYRVRTIKLRGQISQGLVLPLSVLPPGLYVEGQDVTEKLGVRRYDPEGAKEAKLLQEREAREKNKVKKFFMKFPWYRKIFLPKKMGFPSFIKKTDEDRIQLFPDFCTKHSDLDFWFTEKIDGQSATYFLVKNPKGWQFWNKYIFGVCSRNIHLTKPDNSSYWTVARELEVEGMLRWLRDCLIADFQYDPRVLVLQGEIIGPGIQKNKYKRESYEFYGFNLIVDGIRMSYPNMKLYLDDMGMNVVPYVGNHPLKPTIAEMVEYSKGVSKLAPIQREGVVVRNYVHNLSVKVINPDFLLKYQDEAENEG